LGREILSAAAAATAPQRAEITRARDAPVFIPGGYTIEPTDGQQRIAGLLIGSVVAALVRSAISCSSAVYARRPEHPFELAELRTYAGGSPLPPAPIRRARTRIVEIDEKSLRIVQTQCRPCVAARLHSMLPTTGRGPQSDRYDIVFSDADTRPRFRILPSRR